MEFQLNCGNSEDEYHFECTPPAGCSAGYDLARGLFRDRRSSASARARSQVIGQPIFFFCGVFVGMVVLSQEPTVAQPKGQC